MSNDSKILIAIILAAGIFYGGYRAGGNGCGCNGKCGQSQQEKTSPQLKPIQVPK